MKARYPRSVDATGFMSLPEMPRRVCGIYLLIRNLEVVYVGQSMNVIARLIAHADTGEKQFDSCAVLECCKDELDAQERKWIAFFDPIYNVSHTVRGVEYRGGPRPTNVYVDRLKRFRSSFGTATILDLAIPVADQMKLASAGIFTVRKLRRNSELAERYKDALLRFDFYHKGDQG